MEEIRKSHKIFAGLSAIVFYCIILPIFLIWFSFKVDIGRLNISNLLGYVVGAVLIVYGLYWYIGTGISQHKSRKKTSQDYKGYSFSSYFFQLIPPNRLITTGIYAKCRNPMYFGYAVLLIGIGVILRSISFLVIVVPIFILFFLLWIKIEEKNIKRKFGNEFMIYKKKTHLLLPNRPF